MTDGYLLTCRHCGQQNSLESLSKIQLSTESGEEKVGTFVSEYTVAEFLLVDRCRTCREISLSSYIWSDEYMITIDDTNIRHIFPPEPKLDALPPAVAKRYREMLGARSRPNDFSVGAGRTLEAVCAHEGVPATTDRGGDRPLAKRLKALASDGRIPELLTDQAELVKDFRNIGGHHSSFDLDSTDVDLIQRYVDMILDFIYRSPAEYTRVREALEDRK